jgi:hypothetical protein
MMTRSTPIQVLIVVGAYSPAATSSASPSFQRSTSPVSILSTKKSPKPATYFPEVGPVVPPIRCSSVKPHLARPAALLMSLTLTLCSKSDAANTAKRCLGFSGESSAPARMRACSSRSHFSAVCSSASGNTRNTCFCLPVLLSVARPRTTWPPSSLRQTPGSTGRRETQTLFICIHSVLFGSGIVRPACDPRGQTGLAM